MAKILRYKFLMNEINYGTKENPNIEQIFFDKTLSWSEENEEIAKVEAYNGEYTIEDDGRPEPTETPNQLDVIEAQVTYTAMMTDTLLEV